MDYEATASNVRSGTNSVFVLGDFMQMYPQFGNVPIPVVQMYLDMAYESILESRWFSKWKVGMGLYVAHFLTLWAKTAGTGLMTNNELTASGESKGAVMSKGIDGVSVSYAQPPGENDLAGVGSYKDTLYGQQLMTLAKMVGRGGMYVW